MNSKATTFLDEPGPCEGCGFAQICKTRNLTCADFWADVERANTPKMVKETLGRNPTREIFDFIFCGIECIDTGRKDARGRAVFFEPPEFRRLRMEAIGSLPIRARSAGVAA